MTITDPQQPFSRRSARTADTGEAGEQGEAAAAGADEPRPVALDVPIVRRRDLRNRPADAPPVGLTGEIILDPEVLARMKSAALAGESPIPPPPAEEAPAAEEGVEAPVEEVLADEASAESASVSIFAPPADQPAAEPVDVAVPAVDASTEPLETDSIETTTTLSRRELRARYAQEAAAAEAVLDEVQEAPVEEGRAAPAEEAAAEDAAPEDEAPAPSEDAAAAEQADAPQEQPQADEPVTEPTGAEPETSPPAWSAPEGHWSRQLEAEDLEDSLESTLTREVGAGAPTTSTLVVPEAPPLDLSGPLTATGEIMLTGSVKISDSYARTGAPEHVAVHDELDDFFQGDDAERPADAKPVRAASAVSGEHVLGSPLVAPAKPGTGNRALTALFITACGLAVVVTGLIIVAVVFQLI